jgi:predicted aspartyl protease
MSAKLPIILTFAALADCVHSPDSVSAIERNACSTTTISREDALIHVPFEIVDGRVYVQARVNGGKYHTFAIDTGASGMGRADASLTKALGLPILQTTETSDGVNVATVDMTRFDSLDLGGFVRKDLDVITRDYSSKAPPEAAISGIIGRDFFADGLLIIDFPSRTLSFSRKQMIKADAPGALSYTRPFRVPVSIGDIETTGNLDSGANIFLVLPKTLYDRVAASPLETAGKGKLTNTVIETHRATLRGPVRIGDANESDVDIRVSDRFPELLVGGKLLQKYRIAIDQRTKRVALCSPAE